MVWASVANLQAANLNRITNSVDATLVTTTRYLQGTNQPKVQTQWVKNGVYVSVPIKHLEIRVTGNPGMRGA